MWSSRRSSIPLAIWTLCHSEVISARSPAGFIRANDHIVQTNVAPGNDRSTGKTIQAVETTLRVLEELRHRESATLAELDEALPQSKSTLHHHLATLRQAGFVDSEDGTYRLGLGLLTLGGRARETSDLYDAAREPLDRLAAETGELARLVGWHDETVVTLYQATGDAVDRPWHTLGAPNSLHSTAAGKAILANLPDEQRAARLTDDALETHTDATVTDPDALRQELATVRGRGVAFDDEEHHEGVRGVAAPVTDGDGSVLGAVELAGSVERLSEEQFRTELPDQVENVVGVVEVSTTYADWSGER